MDDPHGELTLDGPRAVRTFTLARECDEDRGHTHRYDHVTRVVQGSVRVFYGDGTVETHHEDYRAGEFFTVKAEVHHRIKALEADTVYACEFSHRDFDGLVTQEYQGHASAYT